MRKCFSRILLWKALALFVLVAVGCGQLPIRVSTPEPAAVSTPTPTPQMPAGPYPPVVLDYSPRIGQEVPTDSAITLQFDQPMDQTSVAEALRVTPDIVGDLVWEDDRTAVFHPQALAAATRYRVSVGPAARSREGLPLSTELAFAFSTLTPLTVTRVEPEDGAADLRADTPVFVVFNRAVVPVNCTGQMAENGTDCPPLPFHFSPSVGGSGIWVNTSLYRFDPTNGWGAGETYRVTVDAGVTSVEGAVLESAATWSFATAAPSVKRVEPADRAKNVPPETGVRVFFSTPMDREITGSVFNVSTEDGEVVPGAITWEDDGATLVFTPTRSLALGIRYSVHVGERARAITSAPLTNPGRWAFTTAPFPAILSFTPRDGTEDVRVNEPVRIVFAGALDEEAVKSRVLITPIVDSDQFYTYFDPGTGTYSISWRGAPRTDYCVAVQPGITDRYGNTMEAGDSACFTTGDLDPFVGPATELDAVTLDAAEPARLYFFVLNQRRVPFTLSQLSPEDFIRGDREGTEVVLREWTETFATPLNVAGVEPVALRRLGGPLAPGYYRLKWQSPQWGVGSINIAVVDRHVTLKLAAEEAVVWVTDLRSGDPVTRTAVSLLDREGVLIAAGTTDGDGVARIPIGPRENLWDSVAAVVGEPESPGFGIALTHWEGAAAPRSFNIDVDSGPFVPFNLFLYTDRPIYRPGQSVRFRGILREDHDARYSVPPLDTPVMITLRDGMGSVVYSTTVSLSEMGTFDGMVTLPADATLGGYTLAATLPAVSGEKSWTVGFGVAAYRKPEFAVTVTPERDNVLQGEKARTLVEAAYFFGGPVSNAKLTWVIRGEYFNFSPGEEGGWSWNLAPNLAWREPQIIAEGEGVTDAAGRYWVELPADLKPSGDEESVGSQRWMIAVTLVGEAGFPIRSQGEMTVHASRFYLGLQPREWVVRAGDRTEVDLWALDWDGTPAPDQGVDVTFARRDWYQISSPQPFAPPTWGYTDTVISTESVTTDAGGQAVAPFKPPGSGSYVVIAASRDVDGNPVRSETYLWVSGPTAAQWQMAEGSVTPVPDARSYRVGETARILVPTTFTGTYQILMTVERGSVLKVQRFTLDEPNPVIELPIVDMDVPDVYVSFVTIRGVNEASPVPDVRVGYTRLSVDPGYQRLTVQVIPDRVTSYEPGSPVELTIRTVDALGQTVDAEVGLAVVDKAALALRESNVPPILDAFYGERPLSVVTGDGLLVLFNRAAQRMEALAQAADRTVAELLLGGFGGGAGEGGGGEVEARSEFPDTALWETHLRTGPSGEARVSFKLPDSLTTWVAVARAVTEDTKVGEAQAELVATRPLLIRPVTPRFFVIGDQPAVAAVVHNNTGDDLEVTVQLTVERGASVIEPSEQVISVPAGGRVGVSWALTIPQTGVETASLVFSAEGGGYQDASRPTVGSTSDGGLPIYRYETPDVAATVGVLERADERLEAVVVPPDAGAASALTLRLDPSLAAALTSSLDYVDSYPYETTESLISRLLVTISTARTLRELNGDDPGLEARLQVSIPDALDRLYAQQNPDGGWGWWKDWSDMHITSYVAFGMIQARRAGFVVRDAALQRALAYISDTLALGLQREERYSHYALALYVLSEGEREWPYRAGIILYADREELGVTGCAFLAMALGTADPADPRVRVLLESLAGKAVMTATEAHWEDSDVQGWNTDTLATAVILDARVRFAPEDLLLAKSVRWLMVARRADHWQTPYETAWAVVALTDFMRVSGDLEANYSWQVSLNGAALAEGTVNALNLRDVQKLRVGLLEEERELPLQAGVNVLQVSRSAGPGRLYYAAHLSLAQPVDKVMADSRGVTVQREYCAVSPTAFSQGDDLFSDVPDLCTPVDQVRPGDLVEVRLTLIVPQTRYDFVLDDPYPASMEPVDTTLPAAPQVVGMQPAVSPVRQQGGGGWWRDPFERRELRDERAVFFVSSLSAGTYQIRYLLQAAAPGTYYVLPTTASELNFPEVWGRSDGGVLHVLPPGDGS